ncbi:MAG TPA: hydroxypyruvate isomerase, partial [Terracidiphilus sp.]
MATATAASLAKISKAEDTPMKTGRINQSVCRWCYAKTPLDDLCAFAAQIGLKGVDLLQVEEFDVPRKHGLICTMGYAGGGTIPD